MTDAAHADFVRHQCEQITYLQFREVALANARTLSRECRPQASERSQTYRSTVGQFIAEPSYPVWFVSRVDGSEVPYNDSNAQPISFAALTKRADLVRTKLDGWASSMYPEPTEADLVTLFCTGCDRHIVIDGNHRLLWLAVNSRSSALVRVAELAGSNWPLHTPDVSVVCACADQG